MKRFFSRLGMRIWRVLKRLLLICSILLVAGIGFLGAFVVAFAFNCAPSAAPVNRKMPVRMTEGVSIPPGARVATGKIKNYSRQEGQTYLTLPEWYIVYNADEYASFVGSSLPSSFPYFRAVSQYWQYYCSVYGITSGVYSLNRGYHLTLMVIGISFSVEDGAKGLYEHTFGKLTEIISGSGATEEDMFATRVADEYGDFIHTVPWYEFPFWNRLTQLWRETRSSGPHMIRKWERRIVLTVEYGIKAGYAKIIKRGTQTAYTPEDLEIGAIVQGHADARDLTDLKVRMIERVGDEAEVIAIPRYEAFTQIVPELAKRGVRFLEIAGNDEILITVLADRSWQLPSTTSEVLFTKPVLTVPNRQRFAIRVPVIRLSETLAGIEQSEAMLEHIYDY